jgi:hypothetical protein
VPPTAVPPRPSPTATLPIAPTAIAPTPPSTGNGGFLPGLPNTGAGGMVAQDTATDIAAAPMPRDTPFGGLALIVAATAVTFGVLRRRAVK